MQTLRSDIIIFTLNMFSLKKPISVTKNLRDFHEANTECCPNNSYFHDAIQSSKCR